MSWVNIWGSISQILFDQIDLFANTKHQLFAKLQYSIINPMQPKTKNLKIKRLKTDINPITHSDPHILQDNNLNTVKLLKRTPPHRDTDMSQQKSSKIVSQLKIYSKGQEDNEPSFSDAKQQNGAGDNFLYGVLKTVKKQVDYNQASNEQISQEKRRLTNLLKNMSNELDRSLMKSQLPSGVARSRAKTEPRQLGEASLKVMSEEFKNNEHFISILRKQLSFLEGKIEVGFSSNKKQQTTKKLMIEAEHLIQMTKHEIQTIKKRKFNNEKSLLKQSSSKSSVEYSFLKEQFFKLRRKKQVLVDKIAQIQKETERLDSYEQKHHITDNYKSLKKVDHAVTRLQNQSSHIKLLYETNKKKLDLVIRKERRGEEDLKRKYYLALKKYDDAVQEAGRISTQIAEAESQIKELKGYIEKLQKKKNTIKVQTEQRKRFSVRSIRLKSIPENRNRINSHLNIRTQASEKLQVDSTFMMTEPQENQAEWAKAPLKLQMEEHQKLSTKNEKPLKKSPLIISQRQNLLVFSRRLKELPNLSQDLKNTSQYSESSFLEEQQSRSSVCLSRKHQNRGNPVEKLSQEVETNSEPRESDQILLEVQSDSEEDSIHCQEMLEEEKNSMAMKEKENALKRKLFPKLFSNPIIDRLVVSEQHPKYPSLFRDNNSINERCELPEASENQIKGKYQGFSTKAAQKKQIIFRKKQSSFDKGQIQRLKSLSSEIQQEQEFSSPSHSIQIGP